jgi:hypothetical protein
MYQLTHRFNKWILLSMALVLALSGLGFTAQTAQAGACEQYHTVQKGEYLSLIAREYGADWRVLAEINDLKDPSLIYPGQKLCISTQSAVIPDTGSQSSDQEDVPLIDILAVKKNQSVTIWAYNFPSRVVFDVRMGLIGTRAENGILVDSVLSDRDGAFEATFNIPNALRGETQIAIRLESDSGFYSYNWFYNQDFESSRGGALPADQSDINLQKVKLGASADVYKGNAGFYMPSSNYTGWVEITRSESGAGLIQGLRFRQHLAEVSLFDSDGDPIHQVVGVNYMYFNLNGQDLRDYQDGVLGIYHYDTTDNAWEACQYQSLIQSENAPYGRLACVVQDFGLYGLAEK